MAARHKHREAVLALAEAERPGVVDAVRAAICCHRSALVDVRDKVDQCAARARYISLSLSLNLHVTIHTILLTPRSDALAHHDVNSLQDNLQTGKHLSGIG